MSRHNDNKRIAVLISAIEGKCSVREIACLHGVNKTSVTKWVREHESGETTLQSLRTWGVVPTRPVGSIADAHPSKSAPSRSLEFFDNWKKSGFELRAKLEAERASLDEQIEQLEARRKLVFNALKTLPKSESEAL
jgi:transposase-like protein